MSFSFCLVVVGQFNVESVSPLKTENDTPIGPHRYGPQPLQVAFERVKAIPGNVESLRRGGGIENRQYALNRIQQVGTYPAPVTAFVKPFKAPVLEAPNQLGIL